MLSREIHGRLDEYMHWLESHNMAIYYTPYFEACHFRKGSFNARHVESVLTIEPFEILYGRYEMIKDRFERNAEYICGFRPETRPVEPSEFVVEMLFPDYSFKDVKRGVEPSEVLEDCFHRKFNGCMVMDCIRYVKEELCSDDRDTEFHRILKAPCFLRSVAEVWNPAIEDLSVDELVDRAYMKDCILRYD